MKKEEMRAPSGASVTEYRCGMEACGFSVWSRCGLAIYGTCPECRTGVMRQVVFPEGWARRMMRAKTAEDEAADEVALARRERKE